jgi:uncharacterized membrane protein
MTISLFNDEAVKVVVSAIETGIASGEKLTCKRVAAEVSSEVPEVDAGVVSQLIASGRVPGVRCLKQAGIVPATHITGAEAKAAAAKTRQEKRAAEAEAKAAEAVAAAAAEKAKLLAL